MRHGPYIVVEGADGTGKTTLAHELERYGFHYTHSGPPEQDAMGFYLMKLRAWDGPCVADRLHVGSWVYGQAFRNGPDMTDQEEWLFEGYLMAHGAVLVVCAVSEAVVDRNLARGPDSEDAKIYEAPEKRARLRELYGEYVELRTAMEVVRYDFTRSKNELAELALRVVTTARAMENVVPRFEVAALGNTQNPLTVFVGDRPNGYDRLARRDEQGGHGGALVRKFAAVYDRGLCWGDSPSGRYLFQALRAADLNLVDYCTFNATQWDGRTIADLKAEDPRWWAYQAQRGVNFVALGNLAAEQLQAAGVAHRKVPHPAYVRRFFYKRVLDYARLLSGEKEYEEDEWRH